MSDNPGLNTRCPVFFAENRNDCKPKENLKEKNQKKSQLLHGVLPAHCLETHWDQSISGIASC